MCLTPLSVRHDHHFLPPQTFQGTCLSRHPHNLSMLQVIHMHTCLLFGRALYCRPHCRYVSPQALFCVPILAALSAMLVSGSSLPTPNKTHPDTPRPDSILTSTALRPFLQPFCSLQLPTPESATHLGSTFSSADATCLQPSLYLHLYLCLCPYPYLYLYLRHSLIHHH